MRIDEYEILFKKYYRQIFNYCRVKLRSEHSSFDCVQEVFWILYQKIDKVDVTENILIWLYRTADKVISRYIKKNSKDLSLDSLDEDIEDKREMFNESYEIIDTIVSKEELSLLENYYLEGVAIREIAEKASVSEAAIYKRIERIKAKITRYGKELL
ncbi:MAG: sigma-70 family RNA polymerase sigma factor [Ruminococcus sp.]|nr:sigma-70 family RNA polymerase sigma factor [Ruminococcus sp.]